MFKVVAFSGLKLSFVDSLSGKRCQFEPIDPQSVGMYVCGPTVYSRPHIGNLRSAVVYDIFYRILRFLYGESCVVYVRNITDVDDKIINASIARGCDINAITDEATVQFHEDVAFVGCLPPTREPRVTENMDEVIRTIQRIINSGHGYIADGHVLFSVRGFAEYGRLSGRKLDDLRHGDRIVIESYKKGAGDFVLWKPAEEDKNEQGWQSPFGYGRPGWHIECSALSYKYLGVNFDIHGGGNDLKFPHHENERAQSMCANVGSLFAKHWIHNGHVHFDGEKMSKSIGNVFTAEDARLAGYSGVALRFALTASHYRQPLNFSQSMLSSASKSVNKLIKPFVHLVRNYSIEALQKCLAKDVQSMPQDLITDLLDDVNLSKYHAKMFGLAGSISFDNIDNATSALRVLFNAGLLIGLWSAESLQSLVVKQM